MSYADQVFIRTVTDILENGTSTVGQKVRPHWPDGTAAYTIKQFGVVNRYDLSEEFPIVTLRKTPIKSATDEMLWIWQKKSNNIHDLGSHVWDEWADETGSIGKAYGYQMAKKHPYRDVKEEGLAVAFPAQDGYGLSEDGLSWKREDRVAAVRETTEDLWKMDQVDKVIYDLKNTPYSRRIMTTMWDPEDLHDMHLEPCAYSMTFNVTQKPGHEKMTLNAVLHQRSQDVLAAMAWNICQYAVLIHMIAQVCDMEPGEFVHLQVDCHCYDRHQEALRELIRREPKPVPQFRLNPDIHDFYRFTKNDVELIGYEVAGEQIRNIEVAI
ncbi:MAG: thymidylate synthase [Lachnospiraceae bacterium]|nr:thymidylate synthase [Lachnospiraceae bacterium]